MKKSKLFLVLLFSFLVSCANPIDPDGENTGTGTGESTGTGTGGNTGTGTGGNTGTGDGGVGDITTIAPDQEFEYSKMIFKSSSTSIYRNPAIISANNGNIIAFAEVAKNSYALGNVNAQVDVVYTVSKDGGKTWGAITYILPKSTAPGISTTDNKGSPVVFKAQNGTLIVLANSGRIKLNNVFPTASDIATSPTEILISKSTDDGVTWSSWTKINDSFWSSGIYTGTGDGRPWLRCSFIPSGKGLTLNDGTLVAAVFGTYNNAKNEAHHVIYSQDNGNTWKASEGQIMSSDKNGIYKEPNILGPVGNGNQFLVTARNLTTASGRLYSKSADSVGSSFMGNNANKYKIWNPPLLDKGGNSPGVKWNSTVFAHLSIDGSADKNGLSIYISKDDAATFSKKYTILPATTATEATSAMDVHNDGTLIILHSEGGSSTYKDIVFRRYSMKTVTGENYTK